MLLLAVFFGVSPARATFTRPSFKALPVIATDRSAETPWDQPFKLEICTGLFCGNDPVNRHDPLGLAVYNNWDDFKAEMAADAGALINFRADDPETGMALVTAIDGVSFKLFSGLHTDANQIIKSNPDYAYSRSLGSVSGNAFAVAAGGGVGRVAGVIGKTAKAKAILASAPRAVAALRTVGAAAAPVGQVVGAGATGALAGTAIDRFSQGDIAGGVENTGNALIAGSGTFSLRQLSKVFRAAKGTFAKVGGGGGSLGGLTRQEVVDAIPGFTMQGNKVAAGLRNGDLRLNVLSDRMFEKAWDLRGSGGAAPQAFAYGEQLYLRGSSGTLGEIVHEGTHGLDYLYSPFRQTIWQKESRAYFYERQFQKASGENVDFPDIRSMFGHIWLKYMNPYAP